MKVPNDERLCRFVHPRYWNEHENRPDVKAFLQGKEISVFSDGKVEVHGDQMSDLAFGYLEGWGQAHLTAADFRAAVADSKNHKFTVEVVWRPEKTDVDWAKWKDAHAQVEGTSSRFPLSYRAALVKLVNSSHPPTATPKSSETD